MDCLSGLDAPCFKLCPSLKHLSLGCDYVPPPGEEGTRAWAYAQQPRPALQHQQNAGLPRQARLDGRSPSLALVATFP
jgi:hypothetical protein